MIAVIVPFYNRVDLTVPMLRSLRLFGDEPYRLILINNGSIEDLTSVHAELGNQPPGYVMITNSKNRYVLPAWNQGLAEVARMTKQGEDIEAVAILNNDIDITGPGFLTSLLEGLEASNVLCTCAAQSGPAHGTFCGWAFMLSRECIEKVGIFDPQFRIFYGDSDYARRITDVGGEEATVPVSLHVRHLGSKTIRTAENLSEVCAEDKRLYYEKWPEVA